MQNLPIYLYPNTLDVILDLDDTIKGVNQVMYQRDLKIQKGIKNQVRIQFKNSDQKRIPIDTDANFVFNLFDSHTSELVLQKQLSIIDDNVTTSTRGLALLSLNESDTLDLEKSAYTYSVMYRDPADGTFLPAYSNTYYGIAGTVYISNEVFPTLKPSQEIVSFNSNYNPDSQLYEHKSGNVYAYPEYNGNSALHTLAMYMSNFKGTVYIQGTLSNTPASHGKYTTIETRDYNGFTGIDPVNFNGVFTYIRIMYVPATAPSESTNNNPAYYGSFDKVLYRS